MCACRAKEGSWAEEGAGGCVPVEDFRCCYRSPASTTLLPLSMADQQAGSSACAASSITTTSNTWPFSCGCSAPLNVQHITCAPSITSCRTTTGTPKTCSCHPLGHTCSGCVCIPASPILSHACRQHAVGTAGYLSETVRRLCETTLSIQQDTCSTPMAVKVLLCIS